jgi:hypothetical protein
LNDSHLLVEETPRPQQVFEGLPEKHPQLEFCRGAERRSPKRVEMFARTSGVVPFEMFDRIEPIGFLLLVRKSTPRQKVKPSSSPNWLGHITPMLMLNFIWPGKM